jgi:hypothetical protein
MLMNRFSRALLSLLACMIAISPAHAMKATASVRVLATRVTALADIDLASP